MLVIADRERAIGLAGIMGGASTEVGEATTRRHPRVGDLPRADDPQHRPAARPALRGEHAPREGDRARPAPVRGRPRRAAHRRDHRCSRRRAGSSTTTRSRSPGAGWRSSVPRIARLLGIELDAAAVRELLEPLGFGVDGDGRRARGVGPVASAGRDIAADVAEEVARAHGYERIDGRLPQAALPPYRPDPSEPRHSVRRILAGIGLDEVVGHALIGPEDLERSGRDPGDPDLVRVHNPLSPEHAILRPSMTPSLLAGLAENARRRQPDAWLFDLGKVYWYHPGTPTPRERRAETAGTGRYESWELGIALAGSAVAAARRRRSARRRRRHAQGHRRRAPRRARRAAPRLRRGGPRTSAIRTGIPGRTGADPRRRRPPVRLARRGAPAGRRGMGPRRPPGRRGDRPRSAARARARRRARGADPVRPAGRSRPGGRRRRGARRSASCCGSRGLRRARASSTCASSTSTAASRSVPGRVSYAIAFRFQPVEAGDEKDGRQGAEPGARLAAPPPRRRDPLRASFLVRRSRGWYPCARPSADAAARRHRARGRERGAAPQLSWVDLAIIAHPGRSASSPASRRA